MGNFYSLGKKEPIIRLLQITDCHLFSSESECLLGINTTKTFQAVIEHIHQTDFAYDAVLATGDLIQDHNPEAYHRFAEMAKQFVKPLFWLEGNHDQQPQMSLYLGKYPHIQPEKQLLAGEKWQILLLNSQVAGAPSGYLSAGQLAWLNSKLAKHLDRYALVVLHHNILPTNSAWLDQHCLKNSEQLAKVLKSYRNVKAILHGHIHQEVDRVWQGYRVLATPSTCIQFKPNCRDFTLDMLPQGWREISLLEDGSIETTVKRLASNQFLPDFQSKGY
ncbi:3',5'-cyclic-AMP phosphodiesterase [[Haemophilus] ducreyi]|uniref:3',5'-cyclic-AMP phosphodiesterase n=1 Tax=Haemophilus ducreyi TaxID=730 RepID=UPI000655FA3F|nr:3',5'-cyclic-AMP phosphodiesterase [[Haemophilus] ducreyi]AKO45197.1 3',5'-cyclic-nucleotide phosphodiesterase [[Haemophilus] ducreyi]AKO46599.1 3',5'-cyclic-nucleotide phosphodiesterase [[Haemophilus] ducreyi]AKO47940.1 3',5'-cyclic-nucleotide phosphodiesterase [[Haemophilus] ducreyi]AKO49328.1 3',5'-cyclic-nucleotide phosphodiesterase [[Haemophilus] ducreyi]ANF61671.1 3',5'-cyclic-AMP phosphodiesterase [[Haemophilus] ducreyi]